MIKKIFLFFLILLAGVGLSSIYFSIVYPTNIPILNQNTQKQTLVYEESAVTSAVKSTLPSVVTVGIDTVINSSPSLEYNPFDLFSPPQVVPGQKQEIKQNIGSGFIVSRDGLIVTNKHVVDDTSASYKVITNDNKRYDVINIYRDPLNDIAVLKINASNLTPVKLGDSTLLQLGQMVIAIGTPLGQFQNTITTGVVSGLNRGITTGSPFQGSTEQLNNVIQTDAAINPGNSGGPLLNLNSEVIGINTAIAQGGENIGFAIPVNTIKSALNNFNLNGFSYKPPFLGIRYSMMNESTASQNNLPVGAYVVEVVSGSPADKADIKTGDVITEFAGTKLTGSTSDELYKLVVGQKVGDTINMVVYRNNQTLTKQVTLEAAQ